MCSTLRYGASGSLGMANSGPSEKVRLDRIFWTTGHPAGPASLRGADRAAHRPERAIRPCLIWFCFREMRRVSKEATSEETHILELKHCFFFHMFKRLIRFPYMLSLTETQEFPAWDDSIFRGLRLRWFQAAVSRLLRCPGILRG